MCEVAGECICKLNVDCPKHGEYAKSLASVATSRKLVKRFWKYVFKTDNCWFWIGASVNSGYGEMKVEGKTYTATHVAWFLSYGYWPPKGKWVLHKCDIRQCVRQDHLFLGTNSENILDAVSKGHMPGRRKGLALL